VRLRVDGILRELDTIAPELLPSFVSRLKLLAGMDIADRRAPQDGRCGIPFEQREIDARVASVPTIDGEKIVVRLLDRYAATPQLDALGMPAAILDRYRAAVHAIVPYTWHSRVLRRGSKPPTVPYRHACEGRENMTTCPHCKGASWNIEEIQPTGARFKYYSVQCSRCRAPAGILDYDNIGAAIEELEEKVDSMSAKIDSIGYALNQIAQRVAR
jgi:hypothetical protein